MLLSVIVIVFVSNEFLLEELGIRVEGRGIVSSKVRLGYWDWFRLLSGDSHRWRSQDIFIRRGKHCVRYHSLAGFDWSNMLIDTRDTRGRSDLFEFRGFGYAVSQENCL